MSKLAQTRSSLKTDIMTAAAMYAKAEVDLACEVTNQKYWREKVHEHWDKFEALLDKAFTDVV